MSPQAAPPPTYPLGRRHQWQQRIRRWTATPERTGQLLQGELLQQLARWLAIRCASSYDRVPLFDDDPADAVEFVDEHAELLQRRIESIIGLLDRLPERRLVEDTSDRIGSLIATYAPALRENRECVVWNGADPVWAQLYVRDVEPVLVTKENADHEKSTVGKLLVTFECTGGAPVLQEWSTALSRPYLQRLLRTVGCNKYGKYKAEDISGMYFTTVLTPNRYQMRFEPIAVCASEQEHNRRLQQQRKEPCTGAFALLKGKPCRLCPVGRVDCPRARFERAWRVGPCPNCKQTAYLRRPAEPCLLCRVTGGH